MTEYIMYLFFAAVELIFIGENSRKTFNRIKQDFSFEIINKLSKGRDFIFDLMKEKQENALIIGLSAETRQQKMP